MLLKRKKVFVKIIILLIVFSIVNWQNPFTDNDYKLNNYYADSYSEKTLNKNNYFMQLEIPKINFKRKIYPIFSALNQIKYNIALLPESTMPDEEASHVFIAGHAGNSKISFFRNLKELNIGDQTYLYYKDYKYTYVLISKKEMVKENYITVIKESTSKLLTLITCIGKDKRLLLTFQQVNK